VLFVAGIIAIILGVRTLLLAVDSDASERDLRRAAGTASRKSAICLATVSILIGIGLVVWISISRLWFL